MPFDLSRIGQLLRETRKGRGLTLDEVSNVLFIRKWIIRAIEAGDWDHLPPPVYVKGYVTSMLPFSTYSILSRTGYPHGKTSRLCRGRAQAQENKGS